jgi:hypothetical protein
MAGVPSVPADTPRDGSARYLMGRDMLTLNRFYLTGCLIQVDRDCWIDLLIYGVDLVRCRDSKGTKGKAVLVCSGI